MDVHWGHLYGVPIVSVAEVAVEVCAVIVREHLHQGACDLVFVTCGVVLEGNSRLSGSSSMSSSGTGSLLGTPVCG